jgi:hypothetical protein
MNWKDLLKREPISYRDRKDMMDVQPRLDKGAIAYIQSLGEGNWWNEPDKKREVEKYFDYYSDGDRRLDYTPHSHTNLMGQNKIQIKSKNKTLTEDEWRDYIRRVDYSRSLDWVEDDHWPADG